MLSVVVAAALVMVQPKGWYAVIVCVHCDGAVVGEVGTVLAGWAREVVMRVKSRRTRGLEMYIPLLFDKEGVAEVGRCY